MSVQRFFLLIAAFAICLLTACSSDENGASATSNGVNDVRRACDIRLAWKSPITVACTECIGLASAPRCDCSVQDYAGRCNEQQRAKANEPSCEGVNACVTHCEDTDCDCIEACYAGKDACRTL